MRVYRGRGAALAPRASPVVMCRWVYRPRPNLPRDISTGETRAASLTNVFVWGSSLFGSGRNVTCGRFLGGRLGGEGKVPVGVKGEKGEEGEADMP